MKRREFLKTAGAAGVLGSVHGLSEQVGGRLEPWTPGTLDIHQLAYGRGNSTLVMGPDGTTMLIDAGTVSDPVTVSCAQRPNAAMRPGEWIGRYALRQMRAAGRAELDYAVMTHLHPDHIGDVESDNPVSADRRYRMTGVSDVAAVVPIRRLIDRGFPDYSYPLPVEMESAKNYVAYVRDRAARGERTERVKVGSVEQIRLVRGPEVYGGFAVRTVAANGEVWTGRGEATRQSFPPLGGLAEADYPTENMCSIALRLSYGRFDYFTGGDLTSDTEETGQAWRDIETAAARAAGPVEVAVADHHGYFDAVGPEFVRALQPQVFVIPAWYVAHPATQVLRRMLSQRLYAGNREVYATCMMEANRVVSNQFVGKMKSLEGHVIVRVAAGGESFRVIVTDNGDDLDRVTRVAGPYRCR